MTNQEQPRKIKMPQVKRIKRAVTTEYKVPVHILVALINGDYSGLSDEESQAVESWEKEIIQENGQGHWSTNPDAEQYFSGFNDFSGFVGSTVEIVQYVVMQDIPNNVYHLVDGLHGIHIPQNWYLMYDMDQWNNLPRDIKALGDPDHPDYDEVWTDVLENATTSHNGCTYRLHLDSDLFMVCDEIMTDKTKREFFGE